MLCDVEDEKPGFYSETAEAAGKLGGLHDLYIYDARMAQDDARVLLNQVLGWQRRRSYADLRAAVGTVELTTLKGRTHKYDVQICVLWDAEPGGDIRVLGTADAGGAAGAPVSASFVISPDGTRRDG